MIAADTERRGVVVTSEGYRYELWSSPHTTGWTVTAPTGETRLVYLVATGDGTATLYFSDEPATTPDLDRDNAVDRFDLFPDIEDGTFEHEPWTDDWAIGWKITSESGHARYVYLNPCGEDEEGDAVVFAYVTVTDNAEPADDGVPVHWHTVFYANPDTTEEADL